MYYRAVEPKEGEPVQYLGVYVLKWRSEWGEPTIGFVEVELIDSLTALRAERDVLRAVVGAAISDLQEIDNLLVSDANLACGIDTVIEDLETALDAAKCPNEEKGGAGDGNNEKEL